jgi:hypothetical protein
MSTRDTNNKNKQPENKETIDLKNDLKHFGYLLPTNDDELEEFQKVYGTTQVMFPDHLNNTDFLFKNKKRKTLKIAVKQNQEEKAKQNEVIPIKAPVKYLKNDYFKRLVLAAEIASKLYHEPTFGHVKFVKIQYLCEHYCETRVNTNYGKYAAGPLDPKHTHSIDNEFKKRKWFKVNKTEYGFRYEPDEQINDYKQYYLKYFGKQSDHINYIINLLGKQKSDFCEIVATLFSVWKDIIDTEAVVTNQGLIKCFYEWSEKKKRFNESTLISTIEWMKEHQVVPVNS